MKARGGRVIMVEIRGMMGRRGFLRIGTLGLSGMTLADILRQRAHARSGGGAASETAVIQVLLGGGPSHLDTYDPKPDAPAEFRGEFASIASNVPGVRLSEMLPAQATILDKMALVRGLHHDSADHGAGSHRILTGFASAEPNPRGNDRPSAGSIVARARGANRRGIPPYVTIPRAPAFSYAGYLGKGDNPFELDAEAVSDANVATLRFPEGVTLDRIDDRKNLLGTLDRANRRRDRSGIMEGMDRFQSEAYAMITGPRAREAFDLSREPGRLRDAYGRNAIGQGCLLARRLVEAGVTFVTVNDAGWDHHHQIFDGCRKKLPTLDRAVASLVTDLHDRGLADRVLVLAWGEFGRTPRINGSAGRDHWPGAFTALLAGGGLSMGQSIGSTGRKGESPTERALRPEDILQTVYHVLGVDPLREFGNESGRPMPVLNQGRPIPELI